METVSTEAVQVSENSGEKKQQEKQYEESVISEMQNSMEQNDMQKFYETFNGVQRRTTPSRVMKNDREGNLLTKVHTMLATKRKEHFESLLKRENVSASTDRLRATVTMDKL